MKKSIFFGLMAAVCVLASCDKVKEAVEEIKEGNQEPTMVDSADGLSTTISYRIVGVTDYSYVVNYEVAKSDTVVKSTVATQGFFVKEFADEVWNEAIKERSKMQAELDSVMTELETAKDYERQYLEALAKTYQESIDSFDNSWKREGNTIIATLDMFNGLPKREVKKYLDESFENFKQQYEELKKKSGKKSLLD